ncbi:MAG TPA: 3-phosphoshikimate 1-carboxyvinyltransferase, partial [Acidimicrobiales bacterium]|nr:3-phosphoshikimate 1-carboxyvinyltransferase [Acidimicrobiales bacterium]
MSRAQMAASERGPVGLPQRPKADRAGRSALNKQLVVEPAEGRALEGRLRAPGDKSVSHRALLVSARAEGRSRIRGLSNGEDVRHTLEAVVALGARVERVGEDLFVQGGPERLHEPENVLDLGNSGTGIRLLAGFVAAIDGLSVLQGDASIARRPMDRVTQPLRLMGARVDGREGGRLPPLVVRGGRLQGVNYTLPVASAQVKSALLFAGLGAEGTTTVTEPVPTRAHTEEMLAAAGADIEVTPSNGGYEVTLRPGALHAHPIDVPADPSQAAFWAVAACLVPGSDLVLEDMYVGRGRAGFVEVLLRMGAEIELLNRDDGRQTADLHVRSGPLKGTAVAGGEVASLIDEIPVLAIAAALAEGPTTFSDAAELRVKETDRVATTVEMLQALGVEAEPAADGLSVVGRAGKPLRGATVSSYGDHRIAMAGAVAA